MQAILFRNSNVENEHQFKQCRFSTINTLRFKQEFGQSLFMNLFINIIKSRLPLGK